MTRFDHGMGAWHTSESMAYGATWTTAHDRTLVMRGLVYGGGPLRPRPARPPGPTCAR